MREYLRIGGLEFLYNSDAVSKNVEYDNLSKFIREEFLKNKAECEEKNEELLMLRDKLEILKIEEKKKEKEYQLRQKQVTTYLECKKSFFGRIKYYFKGKKKIEEENIESLEQKSLTMEHEETSNLIYDDKEYYTIEDLIEITKILERIRSQIRNTSSDIMAIEASIERLTKRINNAKSYINEIEEHKKSIFEFWKFVNEDEILRS